MLSKGGYLHIVLPNVLKGEISTTRCPCVQALCLVDCKAVYPNHMFEILAFGNMRGPQSRREVKSTLRSRPRSVSCSHLILFGLVFTRKLVETLPHRCLHSFQLCTVPSHVSSPISVHPLPFSSLASFMLVW